MSHVEYRVRPVIRYIVTRYTPSHSPEPGLINGASLETLGEFDNETFANEICRVMGLEAYWAERHGGGVVEIGQQTSANDSQYVGPSIGGGSGD